MTVKGETGGTRGFAGPISCIHGDTCPLRESMGRMTTLFTGEIIMIIRCFYFFTEIRAVPGKATLLLDLHFLRYQEHTGSVDSMRSGPATSRSEKKAPGLCRILTRPLIFHPSSHQGPQPHFHLLPWDHQASLFMPFISMSCSCFRKTRLPRVFPKSSDPNLMLSMECQARTTTQLTSAPSPTWLPSIVLLTTDSIFMIYGICLPPLESEIYKGWPLSVFFTMHPPT